KRQVGKVIHQGRVIKLKCQKDADVSKDEVITSVYRLVLVTEGHGMLKNGEFTQLVTAPCMLCFNESEVPQFTESTGMKLKILYFEPSVYDEALTLEYMRQQREAGNHAYNLFYFRPFMIRHKGYIGNMRINSLAARRLSQIMDAMDEELSAQRDIFWPCRSRSFFLELLLLISSVYENTQSTDAMIFSELSEDIRRVIEYLTLNYPEKITLQDLTSRFHTNKTTLNEKFKKETGLSVMEYLGKLRIDIACSILKNTQLTIKEIMERVGFKDDAHFNRAFQKHLHCSPSAYRSQTAF
ncbi:MAG: AraC family transcriptional regulator, partial [Clostridia bacterium]|nr:AraC family transcriptional regulator [Clostridia bacterium]